MSPCDRPVWFCPVCGAAVGQYNNMLPYVYIFSLGEGLRTGVGPEAHFARFRTVSYIAVGLTEYGVFAPLYFFRLYRNHRRLQARQREALNESRNSIE